MLHRATRRLDLLGAENCSDTFPCGRDPLRSTVAKQPLRSPRNVAGPFYGIGECMACGAPEAEAPDLLAPLSADDNETYFVRQPETPEDIGRACRAVHVCCVAALRYGGTDPAVLKRLGNRVEYCDHPLPGGPTRAEWETDASWQAASRHAWWQFWKR